MTNKFTLENVAKNTPIAVGTFLVGTLLWTLCAGLPFHLQNKNYEKRTAAFKQVLANYEPTHSIRMGEKVEGKVIESIDGAAKLIELYAEIGGKKIPVPLDMKKEYLALKNGIPTEGKNGYNVEKGQILEY